MSNIETKILPCPFCGPAKVPDRGVVLLSSTERDGYVRGYTITCDNCGIEKHAEYESEVVTDWNTRDGISPASRDDGEEESA